MRPLRGATVSALALVLATAAATLAATPAGLQFGVYTAHVGLGGGGHLVGIVSVLNPPTQATLQFDCGKPTSALGSATEDWVSPAIPLDNGSFSVHGARPMTRFTTVTKTNALVAKVAFTGIVDAQGSFTRHDRFVGTIALSSSPCARTSYTASRLAGPTAASPTG